LNIWQSRDGEQRTGLSMACWRAQKIGASAIGKNRRKSGQDGAEPQLRGTAFAGEPIIAKSPRLWATMISTTRCPGEPP